MHRLQLRQNIRALFASRTGLSLLGMVVLAVCLTVVHRWFASPFAVWAGWDEAYISAFAMRMREGRWLPYVDAVSHRGPVLYWVAAIAQTIGGATWGTMRWTSLLFAQAILWLSFLLGISQRRPLSGLVAGASFVFFTIFAMEDKDGIGFNGELVATALTLLATLLAAKGTSQMERDDDRATWLAFATGFSASLAFLTKQTSGGHLVLLVLWWWLSAATETNRRRCLYAVGLGSIAPLLAVTVLYLRAGELASAFYYFYTYNRSVYLAPITVGYAIESSYLMLRGHQLEVLIVILGLGAVATRLFGYKAVHRTSWLVTLRHEAWLVLAMLQGLVALVGALSTFRFWGHYFITVLPWAGLVAGQLLEGDRSSRDADSAGGGTRLVVLLVSGVAGTLTLLTVLWLGGQRQNQMWTNPRLDPISQYVEQHSTRQDSLFVWGFAAEYYTNTGRRPASRFVYTTIVSGLVPWFPWLGLERERGLSVPGSRDILLNELKTTAPRVILDVPKSIFNRSLRLDPMLNEFLESEYCYDTTIRGANGREADAYLKRNHDVCDRPHPAVEMPELTPSLQPAVRAGHDASVPQEAQLPTRNQR